MPHNKPILYLLCGLSFAGKSTLARKLARPLDAVIVEADAYIARVRPNLLSKLDEWRAIQNLARGKARQLLEEGTNVLFDDLMVNPRVREEIAAMAQESRAAVCIIFLNTPAEIVRQRQQQQLPTPEQQAIYDQHTELLLSQLVPPPREQAIYVEPDYVFSTVVEEIIGRCR